MTRPTTSQIDAYCAALKAWANGEQVKTRARTAMQWFSVSEDQFPIFSPDWEFSVEPAPPKLREVWILSSCVIDGCAHDVSYTEPSGRDTWVHFREVSETADAEIAEKLRNHDALCMAIRDFHNGIGCFQPTLLECMDKHGAKLP